VTFTSNPGANIKVELVFFGLSLFNASRNDNFSEFAAVVVVVIIPVAVVVGVVVVVAAVAVVGIGVAAVVVVVVVVVIAVLVDTFSVPFLVINSLSSGVVERFS